MFKSWSLASYREGVCGFPRSYKLQGLNWSRLQVLEGREASMAPLVSALNIICPQWFSHLWIRVGVYSCQFSQKQL